MSRSIGTWLVVLSLALAAGVLLIGAPSQAQEEGAGYLAIKGRTSFRLYCASCHGRDGEGDGNVAQFLKIAPADLTRIQQRYGEWPEERLRAIIDGREEVRAHGSREMPVWGDVFQSPWGDDVPVEGEQAEERVERKLDELVVFLRTIQVEQ